MIWQTQKEWNESESFELVVKDWTLRVDLQQTVKTHGINVYQHKATAMLRYRGMVQQAIFQAEGAGCTGFIHGQHSHQALQQGRWTRMLTLHNLISALTAESRIRMPVPLWNKLVAEMSVQSLIRYPTYSVTSGVTRVSDLRQTPYKHTALTPLAALPLTTWLKCTASEIHGTFRGGKHRLWPMHAPGFAAAVSSCPDPTGHTPIRIELASVDEGQHSIVLDTASECERWVRDTFPSAVIYLDTPEISELEGF